jgi:hypothetical protein
MKDRIKLSLTRLFTIAAVCLLAWPAAMAAASPDSSGDRIARPGLEFRFDKDAFAVPIAQADIAAPERFSRLSLKLYGGYARIAAGDVNEGASGFFHLLEVYEALGVGTLTGSYRPVHGGFDFGADLIYQLSPTLGIGLGAGYMRNSSDSLMSLTDGTDTITISGTPTLTAIPIRLGLFLTLPVAGRINMTADIGAAYYAGLKFDAVQRLEFSPTDWTEMSVASLTAGSSPLGFHGSLGLEYMISPKMGFFIEAVGRYAKLKNFDQVTGISNSSGGSSDSTDGKLYIETQADMLSMYTISMFTVEETPPVDDVDTTFREPKFDLSGFSLQAGFRIRF